MHEAKINVSALWIAANYSINLSRSNWLPIFAQMQTFLVNYLGNLLCSHTYIT